MRLLLVEDEADLGAAMKQVLSHEAYVVDWFLDCVERSEQYAFIKVQDTGIGIASEHQNRIFDRFWRVNQDRSRSSGGSGLGLAIAQAIAKAHFGSISVQSQMGLGSTFTVRLPLGC